MQAPILKTPALLAGAILLAAIPASAQIEGSFDRTLRVSGPVELDVTTDSGGISVRPGATGSVHIHAILKGHHGWGSGDVDRRIHELERNPPVEQIGNRVRVGYVTNRSLLRNISMRFEIETPASTQLRARADSGGIEAEGLHGPVDCRTDSGGIELRQIGSDVRATADSGGVRITGVHGSVYARADSGSIDAYDVAGQIDVKVDSGGVRLSQTRPAPIRAEADSGGVRVKLAPNGGYDLSLATGSGRINVPEMTVRGSYSRHRVEGKVRGGGPPVDILVDSGGIDVE